MNGSDSVPLIRYLLNTCIVSGIELSDTGGAKVCESWHLPSGNVQSTRRVMIQDGEFGAFNGVCLRCPFSWFVS